MNPWGLLGLAYLVFILVCVDRALSRWGTGGARSGSPARLTAVLIAVVFVCWVLEALAVGPLHAVPVAAGALVLAQVPVAVGVAIGLDRILPLR